MKRKKIILSLLISVIILSFICLFVGVSNITLLDSIKALFGFGNDATIRIIWKIRMPRILAAIISGCGLAISGLIMQTTLDNQMASPSTLGVSNAAVFGANLSIIAFAGGFLNIGKNVNNYMANANPYATSFMAFIFSTISILIILALCKMRSFSSGVVVLSGVAIGSFWTALTTILQFYATDVGLSAAIVWNFGDLSRATYKTDLIMFVIVCLAYVFFALMSNKYNALLSGDATAKSIGINVDLLRYLSILFASLITAVCVSYLGIIGFVGIICPHIAKKLFGQNHRLTLPVTALLGAILLILADTISRSIGAGSALPVGAITSLLGAPFFIMIIFSKKVGDHV